MKSYEVILFDLDGTITRFVRGYYQFCKIYVEAVWN